MILTTHLINWVIEVIVAATVFGISACGKLVQWHFRLCSTAFASCLEAGAVAHLSTLYGTA